MTKYEAESNDETFINIDTISENFNKYTNTETEEKLEEKNKILMKSSKIHYSMINY